MTLGRGYYEPARDALIRWLRQPQRVWLRRAIFQIHLWTGLALGLYVVVLSITGSALVYRAELDRFLATPRATLDERATPMTVDQFAQRAARAYPGWTVKEVYEGRYRARAGGPAVQAVPVAPGGRPGGLHDARRIRRRRSSSSAGDRRRNVSSIRIPVQTWVTATTQRTVVSLVGGPPPRRPAARSARRPMVERVAQSDLHAVGDHRRRRVVARRVALEAEPGREGERRVAALQLGSAQRARLLGVLLHGDVGHLRLVSGHAGSAHEPRRAHLRP